MNIKTEHIAIIVVFLGWIFSTIFFFGMLYQEVKSNGDDIEAIKDYLWYSDRHEGPKR